MFTMRMKDCLIRRVFLFLVVIMLISIPMSIYAQNLMPSGIEENNIREEIEKLLAREKDNTSLAISVFKDNDTIYESYNGFENVEENNRIDEDTVFEWGSITKLLVWVSVMQLHEEGKLDLNQDVRELLPQGFFKKLKYDEKISMINLMNHQGGWQDILIGLFVDPKYIVSLEDALQNLEPIQIEKPGTVTAYSNWGVSLAAVVVEKISGKKFYEYVHENIFKPLDMQHTGLAPDLVDNPWVKEKREEIEGYVSGVHIDLPNTAIPLYPAGQATGTLRDITKFAKALANEAEDNILFKNPDTMKEFLKPTLMFEEYGLPRNAHGMWITNYSVSAYGHDGGTVKFFSKLIFDPESKYGFVALANEKAAFKYTLQIPRIIFGESNSNPNINLNNVENLKLDNGFYVSARAAYEKGIMKLVRLFSMEKISKLGNHYKSSGIINLTEIEKNDFGVFASITNFPVIGEISITTTMGKLEDGRNVIHNDYGDTIQVSNMTVASDIFMFSIFIFGLVYFLVLAMAKIIMLIINLVRKLLKKDKKEKLGYIKEISIFTYISLAIFVSFIINIAIIGINIASFKSGESIFMALKINIILAIMMLAVVIWIVFKYKKIVNNAEIGKINIWTKIKLSLNTLALVCISTNIIYWDLWRI